MYLIVQNLFHFILLHSIIATPRLNLYYTDWVSQSESHSDYALQHNCLYTSVGYAVSTFTLDVLSFCMSESASKFNVVNTDFFSNFTFDELSKQNITSEQLHLWSAPIDIIERYQFYLNQLVSSNDLSLATEVFYNCTLPRFGPKCQYQLEHHYPHHESLSRIVDDFYRLYMSKPTTITCYEHLQCNRGPFSSCLDWSEICDGKIDCFDSEFDEEHCWQLEINKCKDNEYRCVNGQCIPKSFFRENNYDIDCLDASDRIRSFPELNTYTCHTSEPTFGCDDIQCDYTHLTSSCRIDRTDLLVKAMFSSKDNSVSNDCWSALKCIFNLIYPEDPSCDELCGEDECLSIIKNNCTDMFYFPNIPVFYDHIYFAFRKNNSQYVTIESIGLLYICYNNSHYDTLFNLSSKILFNNTMCFIHKTISYPSSWSYLWTISLDSSLHKLYNEFKKYQMIFNYTSEFCNRSNMYQCINSSKCISIHRRMDNIYDCPLMDDENIFEINNTDLIEQFKQSHYKCQTSNKYIHQMLIRNGICDCEIIGHDWCEDEDSNVINFHKDILFPNICDGFVELIPINTTEGNQTDETECEKWECNNIYNHCDEIWNCLSGADEIGCRSSPLLNCSSNQHLCISPKTNQFICLPIEQANDGNIDCLGGYDEQILCRLELVPQRDPHNFYCMNQTFPSCISERSLCDGHKDCRYGDDEQFCTTNGTVSIHNGICRWHGLPHVERYLCDSTRPYVKYPDKTFSFDGVNTLVEYVAKKNVENPLYPSSSIIRMSDQYKSRCHYGLNLLVWLNNRENLKTMTCLCPSSFYGDRCQYQNQRVSLTIKFRAFSDSWQTLFTIIISLIDDSDQRIVHSYQQIIYWWTRHCDYKFMTYLLYSTRPKDERKHYSIHIDIYEKISLAYRGSLLLPINFQFLPVHHLAFYVDIPGNNEKTQSCSINECIHGKCIKYSNNPKNASFCQCDEGWSGKFCTIKHNCTCSSDSLCIGISANNRSICVCPANKFGSRCLLIDSRCQANNITMCKNGGQCIPIDENIESTKGLVCKCPKGFSGERCEIVDNKLILSFDKSIVLSQSIFIHFIQVFGLVTLPVRSTTFRTIPIKYDLLAIYWSQPFHLVFIELLNKNYYLAILQKFYNQSTAINNMIQPSDRCPNISELFNETFLEWHLIRRIKYYHLPCQNQLLNISCFYDEVHFCLCYTYKQKRLANCFNFDHNMKFNCFDQSECENGAECLQDKLNCPTRSMCKCPPCSFGSRCQLSSKGFGSSLDAILGYHILSNVNLNHQTSIVQFSAALTIILIIGGFIDGIVCILTFKNKNVREVGCGLYLLASSIITLFTMIMLGLKFLILILTQMTIISNQSFLHIQCISLDFILKICLNMDQWLNACVAIERAFTITKAINFNKKKSKKAAKSVIIILLIVIIGTYIHDPIYRHLIEEVNDDDDIKRIWCIVSYPTILQDYDYLINIFHFFGPFLINLVSTIILITKKARQQANLHNKRSYKQILQEQIREHKNLLTAPVLLVILAIPRLIISFVSKCMESINDSWLFLCGYFISFIPMIITSIIFILPSKFYKKEFHKSVKQYRTSIRQGSCLIS